VPAQGRVGPFACGLPQAGEEHDLVPLWILQGEVVRLLPGLGPAPLVPAIRWDQAAPVGERGAVVRTGRGLFGSDVDRDRRIGLRPWTIPVPG
jgi:hypothetical protein